MRAVHHSWWTATFPPEATGGSERMTNERPSASYTGGAKNSNVMPSGSRKLKPEP
jgi:hypothetical protein